MLGWENYTLEDCDRIYLCINDDNTYTNLIDNDSMFYDNGAMEETFSFGSICCELYNSIFLADKIRGFFDNYARRYTVPCKDFCLDFYKDFRSLGLSDLITRSFLTYIFNWKSSECDGTLQTLSIDSLFNPIVISCPAMLSNNNIKYPDTTTDLSVEFFEDTNGVMQICYKDFDMRSLHVLDLIMCRKNHIAIKQCFHCKHCFVPVSGHNTKYCSTCSKLSSEYKNANDFQKMYRKKYRIMHVYLSRGKITNTDFVNWCNFVDSKKKSFQAENDLSGFEEFLNQSMNLYKKGGD